jgi:hypothetical protein
MLRYTYIASLVNFYDTNAFFYYKRICFVPCPPILNTMHSLIYILTTSIATLIECTADKQAGLLTFPYRAQQVYEVEIRLCTLYPDNIAQSLHRICC